MYIEATALLEQRSFERASALLTQVVHLMPDYALPRFHLWICLSALGRSASAEIVANGLVEDFPRQGEGYVAKAISLSLRGDDVGAREAEAKLDALRIERIDYLRTWLSGRLAEREGDLPRAVASYARTFVWLIGRPGVDIFAHDALFRLALLMGAAPDKNIRDGFKAVRTARTLIEELQESPARRLAFLVLACARAQDGDFEEAVIIVDRALQDDGLSAVESARCKKLKQLFESETPYRLGAKDPADRLVEIPAIACYFGPLKKIDLSAVPGLTIPGE